MWEAGTFYSVPLPAWAGAGAGMLAAPSMPRPSFPKWEFMPWPGRWRADSSPTTPLCLPSGYSHHPFPVSLNQAFTGRRPFIYSHPQPSPSLLPGGLEGYSGELFDLHTHILPFTPTAPMNYSFTGPRSCYRFPFLRSNFPCTPPHAVIIISPFYPISMPATFTPNYSAMWPFC